MKKICVVGAGSSGLTAIKACKEENMDVDCFEMSDSFGGLWRFHDDDFDDKPSVMKSTVINTSKEMCAFSDFPPPKEFSNYMHNTYLLEYFKMYAERFDLLRHIKYSTKVVKVEMADDYQTTGRWAVTVQDLKEGAMTTNVYEGVMVCAGHHTFPHRPQFEGLEDFHGRVIHTHSLKSAEGFEDKKVLIVGIGNSAVDAAVEISRVSKKVYLSSRRGTWLFSRLAIGGMPFDLLFMRRLYNALLSWDILGMKDFLLEFFVNLKMDHAKYGLKPKHRIFGAHFTINDGLPNCILSGTVTVKQNVERFTQTGVVFEGEEKITDIDDVVLATGYEIKYPFLSEEIFQVKRNSSDLYKLVFPANLPHPSLAFIGLIQPLGSIFPIAEAQSRWYSQLMQGRQRLPPIHQMRKEVNERHEDISKRYVDSPRHTIQVDFIPYMDEIYNEIGAKPNLWKLAMTDPKLFYACLTGSFVAYQFRLQGPHVWTGARDAILSVQERVEVTLQTCKRV